MKHLWHAQNQLGLVALCAAVCASASAQGYPAKPVRMIVPFPAGGPTDVIARPVAQKLAEVWGQQVLIDNRGGAGGNIGAELAAKAPRDGYTLLMTTSALAVAPSIYSKPGFDPLADFAPITIVAAVPAVLVVHPSLPAHSVRELIALAKANPGKIAFASPGSGTPLHLAGELFRVRAGIDIVHVPYKGGAPAEIDLLGGQVSMMFGSPVTALPQVQAGRLRALGVSGARRSAAAPQIPTIAEAGVPGYESSLWYALLAPAGTPGEIVAKINRDAVKVLNQPDSKERIASQGAELIGNTAEQFAAVLRNDVPKWAEVVKAPGAKIE